MLLPLDIDECKVDSGICIDSADCQNTDGGYVCTCRPPYEGDGKTCTCELS